MRKNIFRKPVFFASIFLLTLAGIYCRAPEVKTDVPPCIRTMIRKMKLKPVQNPPGEVWKWEVDGQTYYYVTSDCCDQFNWLYDEDCNQVCAPDGGFTGAGDGNCPVFNGPVVKTLVWRDKRQ